VPPLAVARLAVPLGRLLEGSCGRSKVNGGRRSIALVDLERLGPAEDAPAVVGDGLDVGVGVEDVLLALVARRNSRREGWTWMSWKDRASVLLSTPKA